MRGKNQLEEVCFLQGVRKQTLDLMWQMGRVVNFPKGDFIMRAKEPVERIFIQLTGKSIIYNLTHSGKRKILFVCGSGMLLNENITNPHKVSLFCETIEKSMVFEVSQKKFLELMENDFTLTRAVLAEQERKIHRLGHQLKNTVGSIYLERKLAAKLWKLARDFGFETPEGTEIDITMSMTFLADMLGAPRETTSRICNTLTDYGLIKVNKKRITLRNPAGVSTFFKTGQIP